MVLGMRVRAHEGAEGKASQGPDAAPAVDPYAEARKAVRAASQGFPGHDSGRTMGSGALAYRRPTTSAGSSLPGVSVPDDGPWSVPDFSECGLGCDSCECAMPFVPFGWGEVSQV